MIYPLRDEIEDPEIQELYLEEISRYNIRQPMCRRGFSIINPFDKDPRDWKYLGDGNYKRITHVGAE